MPRGIIIIVLQINKNDRKLNLNEEKLFISHHLGYLEMLRGVLLSQYTSGTVVDAMISNDI